MIQKIDTSYLYLPRHAKVIEKKWGGSTHTTAVGMHAKIVSLLKDYVESRDKAKVCLCIRELNVPFFHHEVMKKALILAMEEPIAEGKIWTLLEESADEGLITSNQISKGFMRISDYIQNLTLDILYVKKKLESFTTK